MASEREELESLRVMLTNARWQASESVVSSMNARERSVVRSEVKAEAAWYADAILASDWLAAHDAAVEARVRETIALTILDWERTSQDLLPEHRGPWLIELNHAATIARTVALEGGS